MFRYNKRLKDLEEKVIKQDQLIANLAKDKVDSLIDKLVNEYGYNKIEGFISTVWGLSKGDVKVWITDYGYMEQIQILKKELENINLYGCKKK